MHDLANVYAQAVTGLDAAGVHLPLQRLVADGAAKVKRQRKALEYRVHRLVRKAVDANAIKLGQVAEVLGRKLEEMRVLAKRCGP